MIERLETILRQSPDDDATWRVYADALQERGDPRGDVIALGARLREGERDVRLEKLYSEKCRAARWPRGGPFPKMCYRVRFEQLIAELRARPELDVREARIDDPLPDETATWRAAAGAFWPAGMTELYSELSSVTIEWRAPAEESVSGGIHIPSPSLWDHDALADELWFDFTEEESALHAIRPIDRFTPEAYAVLYLRERPAEVAYHYCGEELVPTGLTYREWLELLFRARGTAYWLTLTLSPERDTTWVGEGIARAAQLFPDFDPTSMQPTRQRESVPI